MAPGRPAVFPEQWGLLLVCALAIGASVVAVAVWLLGA